MIAIKLLKIFLQGLIFYSLQYIQVSQMIPANSPAAERRAARLWFPGHLLLLPAPQPHWSRLIQPTLASCLVSNTGQSEHLGKVQEQDEHKGMLSLPPIILLLGTSWAKHLQIAGNPQLIFPLVLLNARKLLPFTILLYLQPFASPLCVYMYICIYTPSAFIKEPELGNPRRLYELWISKWHISVKIWCHIYHFLFLC